MKKNQSSIGEFGYRLIPIEGYKTKKGKKITPHWKKAKFEWKHT
jgi:hypothetical protein